MTRPLCWAPALFKEFWYSHGYTFCICLNQSILVCTKPMCNPSDDDNDHPVWRPSRVFRHLAANVVIAYRMVVTLDGRFLAHWMVVLHTGWSLKRPSGATTIRYATGATCPEPPTGSYQPMDASRDRATLWNHALIWGQYIIRYPKSYCECLYFFLFFFGTNELIIFVAILKKKDGYKNQIFQHILTLFKQ